VANSDGRAEAAAAAVDVFLASGADFVIHCGDVGGRHVLNVIARMPGAFVWGDRDYDRTGLMRHAQSLGVACYGMLGEFEFGDKRLAVVHGDDKNILRRLIDEQQYDYILCGNGLAAEDRTVGRTRVLNPGPLHGGAARSAMLLDPMTGKLRFLAL